MSTLLQPHDRTADIDLATAMRELREVGSAMARTFIEGAGLPADTVVEIPASGFLAGFAESYGDPAADQAMLDYVEHFQVPSNTRYADSDSIADQYKSDDQVTREILEGRVGFVREDLDR